MIDARGSGRRDRGLGMKGDAEPGIAQHVEIVGAVADRKRLRRVELEPRTQLDRALLFSLRGPE